MLIRLLLPLAALLTLSSCSYIFDVKAVILNGRLAFIVDPRSPNQPRCIRSVHVDTDEAHAEPVGNDSAQMVANGVYWWKDYSVDSCPNHLPIFYGQKLEGTPAAYDGQPSSSVDAKPLKLGVTYNVFMQGDGANGTGRFRIRADRTVENLPPETVNNAVENTN